ncbi:MAG: hypothetical protein DME40_07055 [Verrucomicrobia bacterium]|nr:MAG: hypothetical protein DME40_07055 [Verrucomicrobiota bacterium]
MSAAELIEQFKALPPNERAQVAKFVVENDDSWIPESLREGMADAEAGREQNPFDRRYVPTRSTGFRLVTDVSFMRQRSKQTCALSFTLKEPPW